MKITSNEDNISALQEYLNQLSISKGLEEQLKQLSIAEETICENVTKVSSLSADQLAKTNLQSENKTKPNLSSKSKTEKAPLSKSETEENEQEKIETDDGERKASVPLQNVPKETSQVVTKETPEENLVTDGKPKKCETAEKGILIARGPDRSKKKTIKSVPYQVQGDVYPQHNCGGAVLNFNVPLVYNHSHQLHSNLTDQPSCAECHKLFGTQQCITETKSTTPTNSVNVPHQTSYRERKSITDDVVNGRILERYGHQLQNQDNWESVKLISQLDPYAGYHHTSDENFSNYLPSTHYTAYNIPNSVPSYGSLSQLNHCDLFDLAERPFPKIPLTTKRENLSVSDTYFANIDHEEIAKPTFAQDYNILQESLPEDDQFCPNIVNDIINDPTLQAAFASCLEELQDSKENRANFDVYSSDHLYDAHHSHSYYSPVDINHPRRFSCDSDLQSDILSPASFSKASPSSSSVSNYGSDISTCYRQILPMPAEIDKQKEPRKAVIVKPKPKNQKKKTSQEEMAASLNPKAKLAIWINVMWFKTAQEVFSAPQSDKTVFHALLQSDQKHKAEKFYALVEKMKRNPVDSQHILQEEASITALIHKKHPEVWKRFFLDGVEKARKLLAKGGRAEEKLSH